MVADTVLAAVGARPATGLLRGVVPLDPSGAVAVDPTGRLRADPNSTDPTDPVALSPAAAARVWAVGDCAAREHPVFGHVPGGHWTAALTDPGPTVTALLADGDPTEGTPGAPSAPAPAPYVFSKQLGHDLALIGAARPGDDVRLRGDPDSGGPWAALYLRPGTADHAVLDAAFLVDSPREVGGLRRLMGGDEPLTVDVARAVDPSVRWRDAVRRP
ncbi:hypothetical protein GCM10025865_03690 [Paraoerskovia sediminicola]|uniref:Reductase C-terminal domain-containing protein n=1 Tax=Paraoerskovia sediminicola TaxID=1138587 RepID=A0ABM8FZ88_9CELL|nr:oxidoreductase C-terminal domain-containing protein [Paraoerskovia sediminicola]BDZ41070.1 hypothetical protein GCM10025865_03690 [Paraoerskovia sediminicola]